MIEQDYLDILDLVRPSNPLIAQAMQQRLQQPSPFTEQFSPFSFGIASSELPIQVYNLFRPTPWFLVAVPDGYWGEGMMRASIRRKQIVQSRPELCFHATPSTNQSSVEEFGLLPGIALAREGRSRMFADSPYYIYAAPSEQFAREWCERFEGDEFLIYPIHCGTAEIDLFVDPCSVNSSTGVVSGYILDTMEVPPHVLGTAIPV